MASCKQRFCVDFVSRTLDIYLSLQVQTLNAARPWSPEKSNTRSLTIPVTDWLNIIIGLCLSVPIHSLPF